MTTSDDDGMTFIEEVVASMEEAVAVLRAGDADGAVRLMHGVIGEMRALAGQFEKDWRIECAGSAQQFNH